jgi:hypothetical protein
MRLPLNPIKITIDPDDPRFELLKDDPHYYHIRDGSIAPYPHGMTADEWDEKIGTPSFERNANLPDD